MIGALTQTELDAIEIRIEREQAEAMIATSYAAAAGVVLTSFWIVVYFYWNARDTMAYWWLAIVCVHQSTRLLGTWLYYKSHPENRDTTLWVKRYQFMVTGSGVIWGLSLWMFLPKDNLGLSVALVMVIMSVCPAGVLSVVLYRRAIFMFVIPMCVTSAAGLLWYRTTELTYVAIGMAVYMIAVLLFSLRHNELLTNALRTRFENEVLAQKLTEQVRLVELASKEKTRFFASASHDLRQPLHSLGLFGSALRSRLKNTPEEPIAQNLMHCVDALESSFSSMLDVSKLDSGIIEPKPQTVSLADVFRRLGANYGNHAEALGLTLRFSPGGKVVLADSALLERLLGNLIHNALKFTQKGGIAVVARLKRKGIGGVSVEIWDTGVGIPEDEVPNIFDEFYQVGNVERDRIKGLGMGLAIVRRLATLMNLPITVYSKVGKGTVFKILLPIANSDAIKEVQPNPEVTHIARGLQGIRVLVIDDEESVRNSTAVALRLYGVNVEVADGLENAQRFIHALNKDGLNLDCVISDFRLRGKSDGIDAVNAIFELIGKPIPALLITGDTAPDRVRKAQQSGIKVLYKPVKMTQLIDELGRAVS
jgi:signal transduction histidine kinase/CheY-like chemotaxis protein